MKNRRRVVLFLVEGGSDCTTFDYILNAIAVQRNQSIRFKVIRGDITSESRSTSSNIINKISALIKGEMQKIPICPQNKKDILEIVHVVDTDGTFVGDECIQYKESAHDFEYTPDYIFSSSVEAVQERNRKKSSILNKLLATPKIYGIPYRVFFFSCNLEHALYNIQENLTCDQKTRLAEQFEAKYSEDLKGFIDFMTTSDFIVDKEYEESWNFIKQNLNSLRRYSNFIIYIKDLIGKTE